MLRTTAGTSHDQATPSWVVAVFFSFWCECLFEAAGNRGQNFLLLVTREGTEDSDYSKRCHRVGLLYLSLYVGTRD